MNWTCTAHERMPHRIPRDIERRMAHETRSAHFNAPKAVRAGAFCATLLALPFHAPPAWPSRKIECALDFVYSACARCARDATGAGPVRLALQLVMSAASRKHAAFALRVLCRECAPIEGTSLCEIPLPRAPDHMLPRLSHAWACISRAATCVMCERPLDNRRISLLCGSTQCADAVALARCMSGVCDWLLRAHVARSLDALYAERVDVISCLATRSRCCAPGCKAKGAHVPCAHGCRRVVYCSAQCATSAATACAHVCEPYYAIWRTQS